MHWSDVSTPETMPEQPWLHPQVIEFLQRLLKADWNVLEHGSGGSTIWMAKRVQSVTSIEDKAEWQQAVAAKCEKKKLKNVDVRLYPMNRENPLPPGLGQYDLVLVDGEPTSFRAYYLREHMRLVKPGGWLVLDNCNNPKYIKERDKLCELYDHITFTSRVGMYLNSEFYHIEEAA